MSFPNAAAIAKLGTSQLGEQLEMLSELTERFVVRFPRWLRLRIEESAKFYRRSINSEIILRLDHSLNGLPNMATEHAIEPPMFAAIEHARLARVRAHPEFADNPAHEADVFATSIRFVHLGPASERRGRGGQARLPF